jgi:nitroimidazol reductase NimA-like FMN-containing flavoprotein (pyridoxamine 5'-phosphate oxidase superfamily)
MDAPFEELDPQTCLSLLREQSIGRLAISRPDAPPHLVPVNYSMLRRSIVFRTTPGTKLDLLVTEPVSFEVDHWDAEGRTGWSVVVEGLAYEASDREMEYEGVALDSPAEQQHSRWVRLVPDVITGRRVSGERYRWRPPVLIPDPGLGEWHGGGGDRWPTEWVQ